MPELADRIIRVLRAENTALSQKITAVQNAANEMYLALQQIPGHDPERAVALWREAARMTPPPPQEEEHGQQQAVVPQ